LKVLSHVSAVLSHTSLLIKTALLRLLLVKLLIKTVLRLLLCL
jgi:hypothetical protein